MINTVQNFQNPITYPNVEYIWSYLGKINLIVRNLLNAAARDPRIIAKAGKDFPYKIAQIASRMRLLSIVGISFGVVDIQNSAKSVFKSFLEKDCEGVALNLLSFTIIGADLFDSLTTFVNTTLTLLSRAPIASLAGFGMPLAFLMSGLGTVSRTIKIIKSYNLLGNHLSDRMYKKKIQLDALGILANLVSLSALTLFTMGSVSPAPFLLLASSSTIRLISRTYEDVGK